MNNPHPFTGAVDEICANQAKIVVKKQEIQRQKWNECAPNFIEALEALAERYPNFQFSIDIQNGKILTNIPLSNTGKNMPSNIQAVVGPPDVDTCFSFDRSDAGISYNAEGRYMARDANKAVERIVYGILSWEASSSRGRLAKNPSTFTLGE